MVLQNARVLYASARDRAWPVPVNAALTRLHPRYASPWVATLAVGVPGAVLAYAVDIEALLGVTSVVFGTMYVVLALAALRVRRTAAHPDAWRMPLWPLPPLLVIGGIGYAVLGSAPVDLLVTGLLVLAALGYYTGYLSRRPTERFVVVAPTD
jgi:amino acid transporter